MTFFTDEAFLGFGCLLCGLIVGSGETSEWPIMGISCIANEVLMLVGPEQILYANQIGQLIANPIYICIYVWMASWAQGVRGVKALPVPLIK